MSGYVASVATIRWGYTLADIDRMARTAAKNIWTNAFGSSEKYELAWMAIVEKLFDPETDAQPYRGILVNIGKDAIRQAVSDHLHHYGISAQAGRQGDATPSFGKYWLPIAGMRPDFTDAVAERLALPQILARLTPLEYEAIVTLAAFGTHQEAASALGIPLKTFRKRLYYGRKRAIALWFDDEHQPTFTREDSKTACRRGHSRDRWGERRAIPGGYEGWRCIKCSHIANNASSKLRRKSKIIEDSLAS